MIRLVIPGPPLPKNAKHEVFASRRLGGGVGRRLTPRYERWREVVALVWDRERARNGLKPIRSGTWEVTLVAYWPTVRHLDVDVPNGDSDAPLECAFDALQFAGVIDDDARIVRHTAVKFHDARNPRLEIELRECMPLEGQLVL